MTKPAKFIQSALWDGLTVDNNPGTVIATVVLALRDQGVPTYYHTKGRFPGQSIYFESALIKCRYRAQGRYWIVEHIIEVLSNDLVITTRSVSSLDWEDGFPREWRIPLGDPNALDKLAIALAERGITVQL